MLVDGMITGDWRRGFGNPWRIGAIGDEILRRTELLLSTITGSHALRIAKSTAHSIA
jgi:hypothetical protein